MFYNIHRQGTARTPSFAFNLWAVSCFLIRLSIWISFLIILFIYTRIHENRPSTLFHKFLPYSTSPSLDCGSPVSDKLFYDSQLCKSETLMRIYRTKLYKSSKIKTSEDLPECFWNVERMFSLFNLAMILCALLGSNPEVLIKSGGLMMGFVNRASSTFIA